MPRRLAEPVALGVLADRIGAEVDAALRERPITALATLSSAGAQDLSFLSAAGYRAEAGRTRAGAVLVSPALADAPAPSAARVVVADPYLAFARIAQWFDLATRRVDDVGGLHPSACVDPRARLGRGVRIGAHAVIEADAEIGDDAEIGPQSFVGAGARIGAATRLHARVTVHADCVIGERGIVHSGTVIGADGFGFARGGAAWVKIPQLGRVLIGNDVEIGANCAIDRGALDDTVIGDGCKLDNLIQIAHNVRIGEHTAIAGCVGIAGSAVIGRRCMLGGGVGVPGHVEICDDVVIAGMTLVPGSITRPGYYAGGPPMMDHAQWQKASAVVRQLPELRQRLRALERRLPDTNEGSS